MRAISAKSVSVAPYLGGRSVRWMLNWLDVVGWGYFSMYSLPALPNICAAAGESVLPLVAAIISPVVAHGSVLSLKKLPSEPGNIFSNPTTMTQSATPCDTIFRAICNPVEPVLQLLLTL